MGSVLSCQAERCEPPWRTRFLVLEGVQGSSLCGRDGLVIAAFPSSSCVVFHDLPRLQERVLDGWAGEQSSVVLPGGGRCWGPSASAAFLT